MASRLAGSEWRLNDPLKSVGKLLSIAVPQHLKIIVSCQRRHVEPLGRLTHRRAGDAVVDESSSQRIRSNPRFTISSFGQGAVELRHFDALTKQARLAGRRGDRIQELSNEHFWLHDDAISLLAIAVIFGPTKIHDHGAVRAEEQVLDLNMLLVLATDADDKHEVSKHLDPLLSSWSFSLLYR